MHRAYLGLGSNRGDSVRVVRAVADRCGVLGPAHRSPLYRTRPMHLLEQPDFTNAVVAVETALAPSEILDWIAATESAFGRVRTGAVRFGPRTIDIDLLLYDSFVIRARHLVVPHPRMIMRPFVLKPLIDLDPRGRHPDSGVSWQAYLERIPDWPESLERIKALPVP